MSDTALALRTLRNTPLFNGLSEDVLEAIAGIAVRRVYEEGDAVYELGDDARDVYFVELGRVRFSLGFGNRGPNTGSIMTEGQIFGWAAFLEEHPRRVATASCLETSTVLAIDGERLMKVFEAHSDAGFVVMRRLAATIAGNFMDALTN